MVNYSVLWIYCHPEYLQTQRRPGGSTEKLSLVANEAHNSYIEDPHQPYPPSTLLELYLRPLGRHGNQSTTRIIPIGRLIDRHLQKAVRVAKISHLGLPGTMSEVWILRCWVKVHFSLKSETNKPWQRYWQGISELFIQA